MSGGAQRLAHPQAIRAVFFDVGYTLLAPHPSVVDVALEAARERGLAVERAALEDSLPAAELAFRAAARAQPGTWSDDAAIRRIWTVYFADLLRASVPGMREAELATLADALRQRFDEAGSYALFPDVGPTLEALRARGMTLGVVSDWGGGLAMILRRHDLVRYFDFAVISAAVRLAKPDPELFATALRRADAIGDYAAHVGDSYLLDVLGARAAGITPILLDRSGLVSVDDVDCVLIRDLFGLLDALAIAH